MPKMTKKTVKATKPAVIEVGSLVQVTTLYRVKRMPTTGLDNSGMIANRHLIAVEDDSHDRVLNFRLEELKLMDK